MNQRWRDRRESYRPPEERIDPRRYGVEVMAGDREARAFVEANHYAASYPAARCRVGLYRTGLLGPTLVGVAVFSVGAQPAAPLRWCGTTRAVELGRFVLLDDVPGNGETWFLARAFKALRAELADVDAVLSYSDPVPRLAADGRLVMPGHVGTIYQAFNGRYHGRAAARTLLLDPAGRVLSERALSKIRNQERGCGAAERAVVAAGAPPRAFGEEPGAWLSRVLPMFRRLKHPGNHVYTWNLRGKTEPGKGYPKERG